MRTGVLMKYPVIMQEIRTKVMMMLLYKKGASFPRGVDAPVGMKILELHFNQSFD